LLTASAARTAHSPSLNFAVRIKQIGEKSQAWDEFGLGIWNQDRSHRLLDLPALEIQKILQSFVVAPSLCSTICAVV